MNSKLLRFLELSREFTKTELEVFGDTDTPITCYSDCGMQAQNRPTRIEKLKQDCEANVQKVLRWEEYKQLQADLLQYFQAEQKLTNN